jgi:hypothetical protein
MAWLMRTSWNTHRALQAQPPTVIGKPELVIAGKAWTGYYVTIDLPMVVDLELTGAAGQYAALTDGDVIVLLVTTAPPIPSTMPYTGVLEPVPEELLFHLDRYQPELRHRLAASGDLVLDLDAQPTDLLFTALTGIGLWGLLTGLLSLQGYLVRGSG